MGCRGARSTSDGLSVANDTPAKPPTHLRKRRGQHLATARQPGRGSSAKLNLGQRLQTWRESPAPAPARRRVRPNTAFDRVSTYGGYAGARD